MNQGTQQHGTVATGAARLTVTSLQHGLPHATQARDHRRTTDQTVRRRHQEAVVIVNEEDTRFEMKGADDVKQIARRELRVRPEEEGERRERGMRRKTKRRPPLSPESRQLNAAHEAGWQEGDLQLCDVTARPEDFEVKRKSWKSCNSLLLPYAKKAAAIEVRPAEI